MSFDFRTTINKVKVGRTDCTDYLIHFTRNTAEHNAYQVLEQIIYSGYLRSGWSIRGVKRTIFGSNPAVCFTEMPLWALKKYAENRNEKDKIDCYGIAFKKRELFNKGARNVIYGTSNDELEREDSKTGEMFILDLPNSEQYRYMLTDIEYKNDWTHEREWRWTNWKASDELKSGSIDGLPIFKTIYRTGDHNFDRIIVIVKTSEEKDSILSLLKDRIEYHDNNMPTVKEKYKTIIYDTYQMHSTEVLVVEELEAKYGEYFSIECAEPEMFHRL